MPAALDLSVTSLLKPLTLPEAGVTAGAAANAIEERKLKADGSKCTDLWENQSLWSYMKFMGG